MCREIHSLRNTNALREVWLIHFISKLTKHVPIHVCICAIRLLAAGASIGVRFQSEACMLGPTVLNIFLPGCSSSHKYTPDIHPIIMQITLAYIWAINTSNISLACTFPLSKWVVNVISRVEKVAVLSRLEQGLPLKFNGLNNVVYVGVSVYVLDPSCASPTCGQS